MISAYLFDFKDISKRLWFLYLIILIGFFAFTQNSQAHDVFQSLMYASAPYETYIIGFVIALVCWSVLIWSVARSTLLLLPPPEMSLDQRGAFGDRAGKQSPYYHLALWLPGILGLFPFLISIAGVQAATLEGQGREALKLHILLLMVLVLTACLLYWLDRQRIDRVKESRPDDHHDAIYTTRLCAFRELHWSYQLILTAGVLLSLTVLVSFLPWWSYPVALWLRPFTIVVMGLCTFTLLWGAVHYLDYLTRMPLMVLIAILAFFFSFTNNNHRIRTIRSTQADERPELRQYIKEWIRVKSIGMSASDSLPMILVATEGGGIRALNWTAGVLKQLSDAIPDFYEQVFSISAVSGGSVGATLFHTYYTDFSDSIQPPPDQFRAVIEADYLSNVTAALIYPEFIQALWPLPIPGFDRSRYLEDSWKNQYAHSLKEGSLDTPFLDLWKGYHFYNPQLFLNASLVETGQKVIISSVKIDSTFFPDVIDFHQATGVDIPIKTAASLGARFPYITSAGTIQDRQGKPWGNLVDGGYYENTGLGTSLQLLNTILTELDANPTLPNVKLMLIFIQNGDYALKDGANPDFLIDLTAPPKAFLNTWGRQSVSIGETADMFCSKLERNVQFIKFELDRSRQHYRAVLPLGWFLSERASLEFRRQAAAITKPLSGSDASTVAQNNFGAYEQLQDFLDERTLLSRR